MRVVCVYLAEADQGRLRGLAEACLRFTPQVALGERSIFLEISGCEKLYSEKTLKQRLQVLLKRFSLTGRLAVALDIPTALAKARYQSTTREGLPIEALQIYASPLVSSNSLEKEVSVLKKLGVYDLQSLLRLPRASLASRFSQETALAVRHIEFAGEWPWPRFAPEEKIVELHEIEDGFRVVDLEPLLFLLKELFDRALLRLHGRGRLATSFSISVEQEKYSVVKNSKRHWQVDLSFPLGATLRLLPLVRDRLSFSLQREPLEASVTKVKIEILQSVLGQGRQTDFFSKKEEEIESFHAVVARLVEKLGAEKTFRAQPQASYRPERSWQKTLNEASEMAVRLPLRPLRLLKKPQELRRVDNFWISSQKRWQALEVEGPERLSGEWWRQDEERDYYRVKTDSGEELWVYALTGSERYYWHGVFD